MSKVDSVHDLVEKLRSWRDDMDFDPADCMEDAASRLEYAYRSITGLMSSADSIKNDTSLLMVNPPKNAAVAAISRELASIRNGLDGSR